MTRSGPLPDITPREAFEDGAQGIFRLLPIHKCLLDRVLGPFSASSAWS